MNKNLINKLKKKSFEVRKKVLQLAKLTGGGGAHLGGTLSCIEILIYLYLVNKIKFKKKDPNWSLRDRVLAKGHVHLALYQMWAELGYYPKKELLTYGKNGARINIQPDENIPGSEYNAGSLGMVAGIGLGIALSAKIDNKNFKTYCLVGDGECDSGSMWESVAMAGKLKLKNLIIIVDMNRLSELQILEDKSDLKLQKNFKSFDWDTIIINGHSFNDLEKAFIKSKKNKRPTVIIANTIKGKGVSFMENDVNWHHKAPNAKEFEIALGEYE